MIDLVSVRSALERTARESGGCIPPSEIDDLISQVVVGAYTRISRSGCSERSAVYYATLDAYRRWAREQVSREPTMPEPDLVPSPEPVGDAPEHPVWQLYERCSQDYRRVWQLAADGHSQSAIARSTGIPRSTVRLMLDRLRRAAEAMGLRPRSRPTTWTPPERPAWLPEYRGEPRGPVDIWHLPYPIAGGYGKRMRDSQTAPRKRRSRRRTMRMSGHGRRGSAVARMLIGRRVFG